MQMEIERMRGEVQRAEAEMQRDAAHIAGASRAAAATLPAPTARPSCDERAAAAAIAAVQQAEASPLLRAGWFGERGCAFGPPQSPRGAPRTRI